MINRTSDRMERKSILQRCCYFLACCELNENEFFEFSSKIICKARKWQTHSARGIAKLEFIQSSKREGMARQSDNGVYGESLLPSDAISSGECVCSTSVFNGHIQRVAGQATER